MRFRNLILPIALAAAASAQAADLPQELAEALDAFRADGPAGWSYVQTTESSSGSQVERYDASRPDFHRWSLLRKDGRTPTGDEIRAYQEGKTRRTSGLQPPRIQDRLDLSSGERISSVDGAESWRFQMTPGGADDLSAEAMAVTVSFDLPSNTVTRVEIASTTSFSPMIAVRIDESRTVMEYSLPKGDTPSLLQRITLHVRGRAFWFRSLDEDMTITYSMQEKATLAVR